MTQGHYQKSITVNVSPEEAYEKIFDVDKWWTQNIEGPSRILHDAFTIRYGEDVHFSKHKLAEAIPGKKIVWLTTESKLNWIENDKDEWTNTKLVFDIIPNGDKTIVRLTHEGLTPAKECFKDCSGGWDMFIGQHLFKYLETGAIMAESKK